MFSPFGFDYLKTQLATVAFNKIFYFSFTA